MSKGGQSSLEIFFEALIWKRKRRLCGLIDPDPFCPPMN
jgi:hypothetical protein